MKKMEKGEKKNREKKTNAMCNELVLGTKM